MEVKQVFKKIRKNIFFYFSFLWISLIFLLGAWWLILIKKLAREISPFNSNIPNIANLTFWEGGAFFIILILLSLLLVYLYSKDLKKQKSLQTFFATMTHELKTPLASIHLQSEVLSEEAEKTKNDRIITLSKRLLEESWQLENHIDKILQLARVERGAPIHLIDVETKSFLEMLKHNLPEELEINIQELENESFFQGDMFALNIIFRNLFENTLKHGQSQSCNINISEDNDYIHFTYNDQNMFTGNLSKVGTLFYKNNSPNGTGIGVYLCKSLIQAMNGQFKTTLVDNNLTFSISLKKKS